MKQTDILEDLGHLPENEVHLPMLVRQMQTGTGVVPFIGAGMSAEFQFPQWTSFLRDLAKRAGMTRRIDKRIAAGQYEEAAEDLISALAQTQFQDFVEHHFGDHVLTGKQFTRSVALIPNISSGPVITTNFDRVLERTFQIAGCPFELVVWHSKTDLAIGAFAKNRPVLLKIHGDWEDPEHRVLTLTEYKKNYGDPDAAIDFNLPLPQFLQHLATHPVLFLGCSLNQDRTVAILKRIAVDLPSTRHYAVIEKPPNAAQHRKRANYLANHNVRPIWYPVGEHKKIERLLSYLAEQVPSTARRMLKKPEDNAQQAPQQSDSIPRPLTSFIGREQEQKKIRDLLRSKNLLTIKGSPGAGKTRVAIELAQSVRADFDRVWFVELSQLQENDLVPQRVATVLRIREQAPRPPTEALADFLKSGKYLLVFNNCEHLVKGCANLADYLLRRCPQLKILTTSRTILNVAGEQIFAIPPLDLPDPERLPGLEQLSLIDSVELLLERAQARSSFKLTDQNAHQVAALCRGLEGLPLAIELAAAQLATLTIDQVLSELNHRLKLLVGGSGGTEERQWITLQEAIKYSYDMLEYDQRMLFRRLSVFHRGGTWAAAVAICREEQQDNFEILRLLTELHGTSLLDVEEANGEKRYQMLDSIRAYAQRELAEAKEEPGIAKRHAEWFLQLAEKAAPELLKKYQVQWLDKLTVEADNFRAAIMWAVTNRQAEIGLRLTASLWRAMEIRGYYREGVYRLNKVLDMPETVEYPALRSQALSGLGMIAYRQGDIVEAEKCFNKSLDIERDQNNLPGIANALNDLGNVAQMKCDFEAARTRYRESLDIERKAGNTRGVAVALFNIGNTARKLGMLDEAAVRLEDSRRGFEAEENLREAAFPLNGLALVASARGELDAAVTHAERSLQIRKELGDKKGVSDSKRTLGAIRMRQGDVHRAYELLSESADVARGLDDKRGITESFEHFAVLAAMKEEFALCVALYSAAEKLRCEMRTPLEPIERSARDSYLETARARLGEAEFVKCRETALLYSIPEAFNMAARLRVQAAGPLSGTI